MNQENIFGRILSGEIPCDQVYSDDQCLAFRDIEPQAPVHILLIPRKVIAGLDGISNDDEKLLGHLMLVASKIAKGENLDHWRTVINTGEESGQTVFHLHIHILGGRKFKWPPG